VLTPVDSYDVVIVGAGVAGCSAALSLPAGARALVVDRARDGSAPCCGGLLAPDAQNALAFLDLKLPPAVRITPEPRIVRVTDLDSGRSQSYQRDYLNVDRALFDAWLLDLAREHADVLEETSFVAWDAGRVLLRSGRRTHEVSGRCVIGADGANSTVRRRCFATRPGPPLLLALQAHVDCSEPPQAHVVLFSRALTSFYAWAIPKGDGVLIGSAFADRQSARASFPRVLAWYRENLGLQHIPTEWSARLLSQPRAHSHMFAGDAQILLAGEAAGLISPSSGEGISFALLSGAAAGRAVGSAASDEAYRKTFSELKRRVLMKTLKAKVIYFPAARKWALRLPWCP
jgi:geranylgeranyl diphosphate/geranylgeranyl-bacteriochlorophyllide a reductase